MRYPKRRQAARTPYGSRPMFTLMDFDEMSPCRSKERGFAWGGMSDRFVWVGWDWFAQQGTSLITLAILNLQIDMPDPVAYPALLEEFLVVRV